ncbi:MAG: agmatinase [Planctomycetales bacterium]
MSQSSFVRQPFQGITTFGGQPHRRDPADADVAIVGIPYDGATSNRSGARFGPRAIREQSSLLWGYNNVLQVAPFERLRVFDYGDTEVIPVDVLATQAVIEREVHALLDQGVQVVALGGDHSISLPLLRAHARRHGPLAVVHLDAHPDTWDVEFGTHRYSHGTSFRRALEEGLIDPAAYFQIGIRGPTTGPNDYADALRLGARMYTLDETLHRGIAAVLEEVTARTGERQVYVSLDIDAVDPAFAPGTGTPEVGGFTSHQILQLVRGLAGLKVIGGDVVEVAPPYDPAQITALLAANLVFEMLSILTLQQK